MKNDNSLDDTCRGVVINPLTLKKNFTWTLAGNLVYACCQWGILIVLSKFGTVEMVGLFALGLSVTAPVILFSNLGLRGVQSTDARHEYEFADYLRLRLLSTIIGLLVIAGISLSVGYTSETRTVILIIGLAKGIEAISDIMYGLLQLNERLDRIAISMMIKGPFSLIALSVSLYITSSIYWATLCFAISWLFVLILYDIPNARRILKSVNRNNRETKKPFFQFNYKGILSCLALKKMRRLAWLSLPLGFTVMLISLNTNIPRYFIEHFFGQRDLGIYAAIAYIIVASNTITNALGQSASPRLAKFFADRNHLAFNRLIFKLLVLGIIIGVFGIIIAFIAGRQLLTLLYSSEYADHAGVLIILIVSGVFGYAASILGYAATASRQIRSQPIVLFCVLLASMASSFLLIPSYQLLGAALSVLISTVILASGYAILLITNRW